MELIAGPHILKLDISELPHLYVTSDLHLNHFNIIEYANRPFADVDEMNKTLIDNINTTVSPDDILINCGDVILGKLSTYDTFMNSIHCKTIYNCIGNHDIKNLFKKGRLEPYKENMHVYWSFNILVMVYDHNKLCFSFTCSHCPQPRHNFLGLFNIHGHLHTFNDISKYDGRDRPLALELLEDGMYYDCGVDRHNYYPVSFIDILKHSSSQKIVNKILENRPDFIDKLKSF